MASICRSISVALAILLAAATAAHANMNLLVDGSFESGPAITGITPLGPGDLPGWTLSGSDPWFWYMSSTGGYGTAEDGSKFINVTSPSLSQAFAVTAGTTYNVSYYEALRQDGAGQPDTLQTIISLAAGSATGVTSQLANNPLTNNSSNPNWELFTFNFTPNTSTTATLSFNLNNGAGYPVLDNVSVTALTASPEPSSFIIWSLGAVGLLVAARRRRKA